MATAPMSALTTRIVLLARSQAAGERALASAVTALTYGAHGFDESLTASVKDSDSAFDEMCRKVPMDPVSAAGLLPGAGFPEAPGVGRRGPIDYRMTLNLAMNGKGPGGSAMDETRVEILLAVPGAGSATGQADNHRKWLLRDKETPHLHSGLWILADRETGADFDIDAGLRDVATQMLIAPYGIGTVVLAVGGFERSFLDAYEDLDREMPRGRPELMRHPLDLARDPNCIRSVLAGLFSGKAILGEFLKRCTHWEAQGATRARHSPGRLAFVQPISSNGFFIDDGSPNTDRSGRPLYTPDGFLGQRRAGKQPAGFPREDKDLHGWTPYMTADPIYGIAWAKTGLFSVKCRDLSMRLSDTANRYVRRHRI